MIPANLRPEKLRKTIATTISFRRRRWKRFPLSSGPQRGDMREFVLSAQKENPILPQRHRGTEGEESTDEHRLTLIKEGRGRTDLILDVS
jgi:hypothetical protein